MGGATILIVGYKTMLLLYPTCDILGHISCKCKSTKILK